MGVVTDFLGNTWEIDCMGCAIASGQMVPPGGFIKQTPDFYLHQDPLMPLEGFLVIGTQQHVRSITALSAEQNQELASLLYIVRQAIAECTAVETVTVVQEERSSHFHLWLFPWTAEIIAQYGAPSLSKIRPIMGELVQKKLSPQEWQQLENTICDIKAFISKKT